MRRWLRRMPKHMRRAAARGLNQGIKQVRTASNREIRSVRPLKLAFVNSALFIKTAGPRRLQAKLTASGRTISLSQYRMKVVAGRGRRRSGTAAPRTPVSVEVTRGRRRVVSGAFTDAARERIFVRQGPSPRARVRGISGPSIPGTFRTRRVEARMFFTAQTKIPGLIERQIRREIPRVSTR